MSSAHGVVNGTRHIWNASAIAGNFLACGLEGAAEIVFAPLDVDLGYADQAMRRALAWSVNPTATVAWLRERDLKNAVSHVASHAQGPHTGSRAHELWTRRESIGGPASTDNEYQWRNPNQRRVEAGAGRKRPSGGHHVAHHQIEDESRR